MKRIAFYILVTAVIAAVTSACSDKLDIKREYGFEVAALPVPKRLKVGETAEIRLQIVREGFYEGTKYFLRYFQPDGKGELRTEEGLVFQPNDLYELPKETFRLYYTSHSDDQQTVDLYFLDNFRNTRTLSFTFSNETVKNEENNPLE